MKSIDRQGLDICTFQGDIFAKSSDYMQFSSPLFIKYYMNSNFAFHIDRNNIENESFDVESVLQEFKTKYIRKGNIKFSENSMFWIGYTYRYWCYTYEIPSKLVYSYIDGTEMNNLFLPYHTMDCDKAIKRICEAKNIVFKTPLEKMKVALGNS